MHSHPKRRVLVDYVELFITYHRLFQNGFVYLMTSLRLYLAYYFQLINLLENIDLQLN
jgi:hypothetical protein